MSDWANHPLLVERRREFLASPMHALTMTETLALAEAAMREHKPLHHTVVNVAKLVNMGKNSELREDVAAADLINVDGKGVVWGARLCGVRLPERVAGIDIMTQLFAVCAEKGFRPYLLGGLGIPTVSPSGSQVVEAGEEPTVIRVIPIARTTALERNPAQRVAGANDTRSTSRMVVAEISPSTSS